MAAPRRPSLGDFLVSERVLTRAQLQEALRAQSERRPPVPLETALIERGVVARSVLEPALERYRRKYLLGGILVATGAITEAQLEEALQHQQEKGGGRLGEVLVTLGFATERQVREALARQFGVGFVDLDEIEIDRTVAHLISQGYAQRHRVIPIARSGNRLTVAMEDPGDAGTLHDLAGSTGATLEVVISTPEAFQQAMARAYGEATASPAARPARDDILAAVRIAPEARRPAPAPAAPPPAPVPPASVVAPAPTPPRPLVPPPVAEHSAAPPAAATPAPDPRADDIARAAVELRAEHEALVRERDTLAVEADRLRSHYGELTGVLAAREMERDALARELEELRSRFVEANASLTALHASHEAESSAGGVTAAAAHAAVQAERDALAGELEELRARYAESAASLLALQATRDAESGSTAAVAEAEARQAETARALADLEAAHAALRGERDLLALEVEDLRARHAAATASLAALEAAGAAEPSAPVSPVEAEVRQAETARALADLDAAYATLQAERDGLVAQVEELRASRGDATALVEERDRLARVLADLQATHRTMTGERDAATRALRELESRHAETQAALETARATRAQAGHDARLELAAAITGAGPVPADLQAALQALVEEREAAAQALRELEGRHVKAVRVLTELGTAHQALLKERETTTHTTRELEARLATTQQVLAELRIAYEALRLDSVIRRPKPSA